jgi:hypothetical protein
VREYPAKLLDSNLDLLCHLKERGFLMLEDMRVSFLPNVPPEEEITPALSC